MLVADNVWALDRRQDPNFVERVFLLLIGKVIHFDLLEGVDLLVRVPLHLVHARVRAFACIKLHSPSLAIMSKSFSDILPLLGFIVLYYYQINGIMEPILHLFNSFLTL